MHKLSLTLVIAGIIWLAAATPARAAEPVPASPAAGLPLSYTVGTSFPPGVNPLTGLPAADLKLLERRPILVKVTNFPRSVRPQWGLSLADHVYEYYIGDEMSRFLGVFYGQDAARVGPVRSARLFDEVLLRLYRGIFVFGWADEPVLDFLLKPELAGRLVIERQRSAACLPLCRIGSDQGYNNLYVDTIAIGPYLAGRGSDNSRQKLNGLRFALRTPASGSPAEQLFVGYSAVSYHRWQYDPLSGRYLRFQEKASRQGAGSEYDPLTDSLTGVQLAADNVVLLRLPHEYYRLTSTTEIFAMPFSGRGEGFALRDGQIYPLTWLHRTPERLPRLVLPDGALYPLKPGNVWFIILGESSSLAQRLEGAWEMNFSIP